MPHIVVGFLSVGSFSLCFFFLCCGCVGGVVGLFGFFLALFLSCRDSNTPA